MSVWWRHVFTFRESIRDSPLECIWGQPSCVRSWSTLILEFELPANLWTPHAGRVKIELLVHLSRSPWLDWPINLWEDAYNYLHPVSLSSTTVVRHRPFLPLKLIVILHNSGEGKNVQNSTSLPMLSSLESVFEQFLMESNIFNSQAGLEITHFSSLFLVRNFQFD